MMNAKNFNNASINLIQADLSRNVFIICILHNTLFNLCITYGNVPNIITPIPNRSTSDHWHL